MSWAVVSEQDPVPGEVSITGNAETWTFETIYCETLEAAENFIGTWLQDLDPDGVHLGLYTIDGPCESRPGHIFIAEGP